MSIDHRILIFPVLPADPSNSHGSGKIVCAGFSHPVGAYHFVGMFNQVLQQCMKIDLCTIFEVTLDIAPYVDLPQSSSPLFESGTFGRLCRDCSGCASSHPIENRYYTGVRLYEEAVLVSLGWSFTCDTITDNLD